MAAGLSGLRTLLLLGLDVGPKVSSVKNSFFVNLYGIPHGVSRYRRRRRARVLVVCRYDPAVESAEEDA